MTTLKTPNLLCPKNCGEVEPTLVPAGPHMKAVCSKCGAYIKFVSVTPKDEIKIHFGRYKGRLMSDIAKEDSEYLRWVYEQAWSNKKLKEDIDFFLSKK